MNLLKGSFTVPKDVSDERVRERQQAYIKKYAESFEMEGWKLVSPIAVEKCKIPLSEDIYHGRVRWMILGFWERKPVKQTFEVDEKIIPKLLDTGKFELA
jgi:hypothetical protein